MGILHGDQYTFVIISRLFLLITRNVSEKSCTDNQNTHFDLHNFFFFFSKIVTFMRYVESIVQPGRPKMII